MTGGPTTLEEMIGASSRGVLVTRMWYTNMLDPRTLLITGLTHEGNFLIENERIAGPVRNFRFNESLVTMLGKLTRSASQSVFIAAVCAAGRSRRPRCW
jgi:predicted Zn-dependent protease